ncbi:hypothetical protein ACTPEF_24420, partial [Clostridioides difficile]
FIMQESEIDSTMIFIKSTNLNILSLLILNSLPSSKSSLFSFSGTIAAKIGKIFASNIEYVDADYVVTMETKGIPMALMTAKAMNL